MKESNTVSPAVTVLLSCYNGARWLNEAIESVLNQSFSDFEFIIVDDGSTDNSLEIIRHFAAYDPRIVIITKNNTGLADSLNVGIREARGEWIARLDADDICNPLRLEKQLNKARENTDLVFIGSGLLAIDENGNALKTYYYPESHTLLVRNLYTSRKFPPHSSALYRTDVVRSIGGYRTRIRRAEDRDLWLRLSEVGQLASITEPLVKVRKHSAQISHDDSGKRQLIDSKVAITSYWIRRYGFSDPVIADAETFENFLSWMTNRIERDQLFDYCDYISCAKTKVSKLNKSPSGLCTAIKYTISKPNFLVRSLKCRFFGNNLAQRLALEWIKLMKC